MLIWIIVGLVQLSTAQQVLFLDNVDSENRFEQAPAAFTMETGRALLIQETTHGLYYRHASQGLRTRGLQAIQSEMWIQRASSDDSPRKCSEQNPNLPDSNCAMSTFLHSTHFQGGNIRKKLLAYGTVLFRPSDRKVLAIDIDEVIIRCGAPNCR